MELARVPLRRIGIRLAEGIDSTLLVLLLSLSMIGLAALFSASYDVPSRVAAQLGNLAFALVAMWLVAQVPPQTIWVPGQKHVPPRHVAPVAQRTPHAPQFASSVS